MHKIQMYENLIDMLDREAKEIESRGELDSKALDWLFKVTSSIKAIDKHIMCLEEKEGSSSRSSYARGSNSSNNSYARMGRDGDNDGRYSEDNFRYSTNRGGSYNYSGANSRHSMVDTLEQMAQAAVDEHERRILMDCMNKLK